MREGTTAVQRSASSTTIGSGARGPVRADAKILKAARVRDYSVREWLARCDSAFVRQAQAGRRAEADYRVIKGETRTLSGSTPSSRRRRSWPSVTSA
jgi:hypothetical protein